MSDGQLPGVIFIGPTRTGTTWIHQYLSARGDVALPIEKELYFFDQRYNRGIEWYKKQFTYIKDAPVVEVAPTYFYSDQAPCRIKEMLGQFKVVVILRNQAELAYSTFSYNMQYGRGPVDFASFINNHSTLEYFRYTKRIQKWIDVIGLERIHFLRFCDFQASKTEYIKSICSIIGLEFDANDLHMPSVINSKINQSGMVPKYLLLARISNKLSLALKKTRLSHIVTLLKRLGLKNIVYAPTQAHKPVAMTQEQRKFILEYFCDDVLALEKITRMDLGFMRK